MHLHLHLSLRRVVLLLLFVCCAGSHAADAPASVDDTLDKARAQMDSIQAALRRDAPDAEMADLRSKALALQTQTSEIAEQLAPELANVQARLTELGAAPATGAEPPDVAAQRATLQKSATQLDARVKLAKLLTVEGGQAAEQVSGERRARFSARLGERTASILAKPFWSELRDGIRRDTARLVGLGAELRATAVAKPVWVWLIVLAFAVAMFGLRMWIGRALRGIVSTRVRAGRLRRSLYAVLQTALSVLAPGLAAHAVRLGFAWSSNPSPAVDSLLVGAVGVICFGAYIAGLGKALLSPKRPTWRLPPLSDRVAEGMQRYPLLLALVIVVGWQLQQLATLVNSGLATVVAINCVFALALGALMAHVLGRAEHLRRQSMQAKEDVPPRPIWMTVVKAGMWLALVLSLIGLLVGYVALGSFVVGQIAWIATVLATAYLLCAAIDDALMTWLASMPPVDDDPTDKVHAPKVRDQAAVLLSGLLRVGVVLLAVVFIAAPFGQGPNELIQRTDQIRQGLAIGEIQVQPVAVLQAVLVFALGMFAVRALQRWLDDHFLPTTSLDPGMRTSATTLLGFVGAVVAIALALSAVGLGLERIAWVASALSVGIGFGLQAVVSNFVSGLILLAERPVKVGDWVALGGVEGDIRRINVRATEIQMGDRSTLIVPNSEFITKTVRNITMANSLGLVQIKLPMPLDTDVERVRSLMLEAFERNDDVLDTPAPAVALDGIDASGITFNATGFVASPRLSYNVRSALLFEVLTRLREAKLPMSKPLTMVMRDSGPGDQPMLPGLTPNPSAP